MGCLVCHSDSLAMIGDAPHRRILIEMSQPKDQITILLQRLRSGDRNAESELIPIVYQHLHAIAERQFRLERKGHTLQPTALLSELYLRMIRDPSVEWQSRAHFYAIAAETIRRILVDH